MDLFDKQNKNPAVFRALEGTARQHSQQHCQSQTAPFTAASQQIPQFFFPQRQNNVGKGREGENGAYVKTRTGASKLRETQRIQGIHRKTRSLESATFKTPAHSQQHQAQGAVGIQPVQLATKTTRI